MSSINCKQCGCPNEVNEGQSTYICEACGTEQTLPKIDSDRKVNLFNRANAARLKCDFAKALSFYEQILIDYPDDAESHWGVVLSRYGIEYVDDPKTQKKVPTCHRTIYNSIFDDIDYKEAIKYADVVARRLYQEEAEAINKIQKGIIAISQKETPYDIFICYKETTDNGQRTRDSYVAEDIYNELTNKGYKVFFSRISLESKLGMQYEPIIFAALQSSRVMLVIGSKYEYFNAVWVKNEWSRFLSFMEENKGNKYMIPCYRDMEAYDMPEEFLPLQSQNLDRLGAKQDLVRAIDKIFGKESVVKQEIYQTYSQTKGYEGLLKRAKLCIEDEEYTKADSLIENVLNMDAECAEAYYLKFFIDYRITKEEDIYNLDANFYKNRNFERTIRFGDKETKDKLNNIIKNYNARQREKECKNIYVSAITYKINKNYSDAIDEFNKILDYEDSKYQLESCKKALTENIYDRAIELKNNKYYSNAIKEFEKIIDYKDSKLQIKYCNESIIIEEKNALYQICISEFSSLLPIKSNEEINQKKEDLSNILDNLNNIIDYKDAKELIETFKVKFDEAENRYYKSQYDEAYNCLETLSDKKIYNRKKFNANLDKLKNISYLDSIEKYNYYVDLQKNIEAEIEEDKQTKIDKAFLRFKISTSIVAFIIAIILLIVFLFVPMIKYNDAIELIENNEISQAENILKEINFKDSKELLKLIYASKDCKLGDYNSAISKVKEIGGRINGKFTSPIDSGFLTQHEDINIEFINGYIPKKEKWKFRKWKLKDYSINYVTYDIDIIFEAEYYYETYSITYELNGGNIYNAPKEFNYFESISVPLPERQGYKFIGWNEDLNIDGYDALLKGKVESKVLTANWEPLKYNINYYSNGQIMHTDEITYDEEYSLYIPQTSFTDMTFEKWIYKNGDEFLKNNKWQINHDVDLYPLWKTTDNLYYLTINNNMVEIDRYLGNGINVTIPNFVTSIGKEAFSGCSSLIEIIIPNSVTTIGDNAFMGCSSLKNIIIPNSVITIGDNAFMGCSSLIYNIYDNGKYLGNEKIPCLILVDTTRENITNIIINERCKIIYSCAFYACSSLKSIIIPNSVTYIGKEAFSGCSSLIDIIIPNSVTTINYNAFYKCSSLVKITIPNSITTIEDNAFMGCTSLTEIIIPNSITHIGKEAFSGCSSLIEIIIPNSVTTIRDNTFMGCSSLKSIIMPNSVTYIGKEAYRGCSSLIDITIPNSVTSIGDNAFMGCSSLKSIIIPNSVIYIGKEAFSGCSLLIDITIPNSVTTIGDNAFSWCSSLNNIIIPNSITYIGKEAFYKCSSLKSLTIPNSVTTIGDYAFARCSSLTEIIIPNSVTTIGDNAFMGCTSLRYNIYDNGKYLGNETNPYLVLMDTTSDDITNIIINESCRIIYSYALYECSSLQSLIMKNSVTYIGKEAFSGCSSLTDIIIPNSVITIGDNAFMGCSSLKNIIMQNSVTYIGKEAFSGCSLLIDIIIPNSVTTIGDNAFMGCTSLRYNIYDNGKYLGNETNPYLVLMDSTSDDITNIIINENCKIIYSYALYECSALESLIIPNNVISLGQASFARCSSLQSLIIPNSVTSIGNIAFYECISLESITIPNSIITIGSYSFNECSSLTIYCEATSKPAGWSILWNQNRRPVVWGYLNN